MTTPLATVTPNSPICILSFLSPAWNPSESCNRPLQVPYLYTLISLLLSFYSWSLLHVEVEFLQATLKKNSCLKSQLLLQVLLMGPAVPFSLWTFVLQVSVWLISVWPAESLYWEDHFLKMHINYKTLIFVTSPCWWQKVGIWKVNSY